MREEVLEVLNQIGYVDLQEDITHWRCAALYRGGDNRTSLCIEKETGIWYDFVQGIGGNLKKLVKLTVNNDVNIQDILNKIQEEEAEDKEDKIQEAPIMKQDKTWDIKELNKLLPHYKFYEDRGISERTLRFFKSGMQHSGALNARYVFPILNDKQQIIGWSGRDMTNRWHETNIKWKHLGSKKSWVYPAYIGYKNGSSPCIDNILEHNMVIIVESIGDMLALWENGHKNVLVTFGLNINANILALLMKLNCDIVIATNNDMGEINRGQIAAYKIFLKCMEYFDLEKLHIIPPTKNDFGDMNEDDILNWYTNVVDVIRNDGSNVVAVKNILEYLSDRYKNKNDKGQREITKAEIKKGKLLKMYLESYE